MTEASSWTDEQGRQWYIGCLDGRNDSHTVFLVSDGVNYCLGCERLEIRVSSLELFSCGERLEPIDVMSAAPVVNWFLKAHPDCKVAEVVILL